MIAGGAILDGSQNAWVGLDGMQNRMFECLLDCLPTFVVPHPGPRSIVPQDDVALADGTVTGSVCSIVVWIPDIVVFFKPAF